MKNISIRQDTDKDKADVLALYPAAFPEEDLVPLVQDLLEADEEVISLVAESDGSIVGHAALTVCGVEEVVGKAALLGPIAVSPKMQKQGIGSSLINEGLEMLKTEGVLKVLVLGDPNYYSRFGFREETSVMTPYPIPAEWAGAWQSLNLNEDGAKLTGTLVVPKMWQREKLWSE